MRNDTKCNIYLLVDKLGLNPNEINKIMNKKVVSEQISFSNGPPWYPGGKYGTISINEFLFYKKI